jgi:hypothetical protein
MLKKLSGPKKEDICPSCGEACYATDVLCPNCGKNLDELFEQLPPELLQTKPHISILREYKWLTKWVIVIAVGLLLLVYWVRFLPTWKNLKPAEAITYFSGEYSHGFMWGWYLSIKPDQTFWLGIFTDMGFHFEYTGKFAIEGNNLRLIASDPQFDEPTEYLPIRWGDRRYIIPANMVLEFCDDIKQGWEPRDDPVAGRPYYLGEGDWEKPTRWSPKLLDGRSLCQ